MQVIAPGVAICGRTLTKPDPGGRPELDFITHKGDGVHGYAAGVNFRLRALPEIRPYQNPSAT